MQQRSQETQARILEAAASLFARQGYEGAGVAEICQEAGVSKGAFYHHFPSKHDVFMRLLENWLVDLDPQILAAVHGNADVAQGLVEMGAMARVVFDAARNRLPMFLEFWTQAARQPDVWQATVAPYRRYEGLFAQIVREGAVDGSLRPIPADLGARVIFALVIGMLLQGMLDPQGTDWSEATSKGIQLLIDGMGRRRI